MPCTFAETKIHTMITIKVYSDIGGKSDKIFCDITGSNRKLFDAETVKDMFAANPGERDFRFDIHCNGGSIGEGFAIYDIMRRSGKRIWCNIDGNCHSMAVIVLLAAPRENRTANPKATALIHDVRTFAGGNLSAAEAQSLALTLLTERDKILDVYAERTGARRNELEAMMLAEREHSADELLKWGFISKINRYTTNFKQSKMSKKPVLNRIVNYLNGVKAVNRDFTDENGELLFSTTKEDDSLTVGDEAAPDGEFTLPDGRTIVVVDGVITEIVEAESLQNRLADANRLLREAKAEIERLSKIRSSANIAERRTQVKPSKETAFDKEEIKNQIRENLKKRR